MAIYVVMEPEDGGAMPAGRSVFVRDGFSVLAFLVPFVWLLWNRLWIEGALALGAALLLASLGEYGGHMYLAPLLSILVSLYVGLEGAALRVNALRRRGWRDAGVIEADNLADAEIRYLAGFETPGDDHHIHTPTPDAFPAKISSRAGPALGLFSYPGGR